MVDLVLELLKVPGEELVVELFGMAREGGVGFNNDECVDYVLEFVESKVEEIELAVEKDNVNHFWRGLGLDRGLWLCWRNLCQHGLCWSGLD